MTGRAPAVGPRLLSAAWLSPFSSPDTSPCYNVSREPLRSVPHEMMARLLMNVWRGVVTWEEAVPAGDEGNWEWQLTVDARSLSASWCMGFTLKMQARQGTLLVGPCLQEVVHHPVCAECGHSCVWKPHTTGFLMRCAQRCCLVVWREHPQAQDQAWAGNKTLSLSVEAPPKSRC